jgi:hypothetical protein
MKQKHKNCKLINIYNSSPFIVLCLLLHISSVALSQNLQNQVELSKSTIDSGGGQSSSGTFFLTGTIGQPDASTISSSGTTLTSSNKTFLISGGFWANATIDETSDLIFENGFESQ